MRALTWIACLMLTAIPAATGHAVHGEELFYYMDEGRVVITNTPSRADIRTVPGYSSRVMAAMRSDLPPTPYDPTIRILAGRHGLSPDLIKAVAWVESAFKPDAVSPKGAVGLMQLMPSTAAMYGVTELTDPEQNLKAGVRHLASLMDEFGGDLTLVLAAYNAGSGAVRRHGGVPAYKETRNYVRKVRARLGEVPARRTAAAPARESRIRTTVGRDGILQFSN